MRVLFLAAALAIGLLILFTLVQIARADTVLDRLLNTALAAANALVLLILIGFVFERPNYFGDIGLAYALLAFLFPLAFAKYLEAEHDSGGPGLFEGDDHGGDDAGNPVDGTAAPTGTERTDRQPTDGGAP